MSGFFFFAVFFSIVNNFFHIDLFHKTLHQCYKMKLILGLKNLYKHILLKTLHFLFCKFHLSNMNVRSEGGALQANNLSDLW